jgi:bis(5'-nucleosidyl)-tetraphosphatase
MVVRKNQDGGWRFLLLRVYGYWDFPKGIVEPGEEPLEAARRETREETSITDLDFRWGYDFRETPPYNRGGKIARYYLAETHAENVSLPVNPEIGKPEHDAFKWATYEEAKKLVAPRVLEALKWARGLLEAVR